MWTGPPFSMFAVILVSSALRFRSIDLCRCSFGLEEPAVRGMPAQGDLVSDLVDRLQTPIELLHAHQPASLRPYPIFRGLADIDDLLDPPAEPVPVAEAIGIGGNSDALRPHHHMDARARRRVLEHGHFLGAAIQRDPP